MSSQKYYYFDTNVLFKHYHCENESVKSLIHRLTSTDYITVYISELTHLEFLNVVMRHFRQGKIIKRDLPKILNRLEKDIGNRFQLIKIPENSFSDAKTLIRTYANKLELSTNDALHIAIAKSIPQQPLIMVTSDGGKGGGKMKGVCEKIKLAIFDPEIDTQIPES